MLAPTSVNILSTVRLVFEPEHRVVIVHFRHDGFEIEHKVDGFDQPFTNYDADDWAEKAFDLLTTRLQRCTQ